MNILIIAPKYREAYGEYYEFPLGLACISAVLKKESKSVSCLNLNHHIEKSCDAVAEYLQKNEIDIVCTGGLSAHFNKIEEIVATIRDVRPEIKIILGGGIVSSEPQLIFEALGVDFGVLQEGEITICELVSAIESGADASKVNGIIYKGENGKSVISTARDSIENLDGLPFPDYEGFEVGKYLDMQMPNDNYYMYPFDKPRILPVISTRSCPFSCTFCYHPLGKKYRKNSLDYFFCWLEMLVEKYQINMVAILDELFSVNKERMMEFAERMKRYNLLWIAQMRVDDVDDETLEKLRESGCFYISYGIESADDTVLKSMKKKMKISATDKALALTRKHNIGIQGNLIFGDPNETIEMADTTLKWWNENRRYQINLGLIEPYPGTPIYMDAVRDGKIKDRLEFIKKGCPPMNLSKMSDQEYGELAANIVSMSLEDRIYAKVIKSEKMGEVQFKGNVFRFTVECPHCESMVEYGNMHQGERGIFKLGCRVCNQRFDLSPFEVFPDNYEDIGNSMRATLKAIEERDKICVIPCVDEGRYKSSMSVLFGDRWRQMNIQYYFDGDKSKIGRKYVDGVISDYMDGKPLIELDKSYKFVIPPTYKIEISEKIRGFLLAIGIDEIRIIQIRHI